jgi:hypothetical protein
MVKVLIRCHKVVKTLIDNGASLNLIMRKTFIKMGLNLSHLTPVHDTFHSVILGQTSTPIGRIDLEVLCGSWDNKHRETIIFKVMSFDIGYNCMLGRPFLLKFMAVIHTAYATMKMPGPKGIITIKADRWDALAWENASLSHTGWFSDKEPQDYVAKTAKTQGDSAPRKTSATKPSISDTLRTSTAQKGAYIASTST